MIKLNTTDAQLHGLQHAVNEAREGSESIRVDKAALRHLLLDHASLHTALHRKGITTEAEKA